MNYKYELNREMSIEKIDYVENLIYISFKNKVYRRCFKTPCTTISKDFGYIIFRFKNRIYKIKK